MILSAIGSLHNSLRSCESILWTHNTCKFFTVYPITSFKSSLLFFCSRKVFKVIQTCLRVIVWGNLLWEIFSSTTSYWQCQAAGNVRINLVFPLGDSHSVVFSGIILGFSSGKPSAYGLGFAFGKSLGPSIYPKGIDSPGYPLGFYTDCHSVRVHG